MTRRILSTTFTLLLAATAARGDGLLFSYEGDILPGDPGFGFHIYGPCEPDCLHRLEGGHFILEWGAMGDIVSYGRFIAQPPDLPPPTLWIEWQFRSNQPIPTTSTSCDGRLTIDYIGIIDIALMFQDAVVDNEGGDFVLGLAPDIFHTYRFESLDGEKYTMSVDGVVFNVEFDGGGDEYHSIFFGGIGSCPGFRPQPVRNEWDFTRYGTLGSGEQIVSVDPPPGSLTAAEGAQFRSFVITFDQPAYLYVDDITVTTTGGTPPTIEATRRLDNGPPEVLEVFVDRMLPPGETTTFTFDTGTGPQDISYFRIQPEIPATSARGIVSMGTLALLIGAFVLRRRQSAG